MARPVARPRPGPGGARHVRLEHLLLLFPAGLPAYCPGQAQIHEVDRAPLPDLLLRDDPAGAAEIPARFQQRVRKARQTSGAVRRPLRHDFHARGLRQHLHHAGPPVHPGVHGRVQAPRESAGLHHVPRQGTAPAGASGAVHLEQGSCAGRVAEPAVHLGPVHPSAAPRHHRRGPAADGLRRGRTVGQGVQAGVRHAGRHDHGSPDAFAVLHDAAVLLPSGYPDAHHRDRDRNDRVHGARIRRQSHHGILDRPLVLLCPVDPLRLRLFPARRSRHGRIRAREAHLEMDPHPALFRCGRLPRDAPRDERHPRVPRRFPDFQGILWRQHFFGGIRQEHSVPAQGVCRSPLHLFQMGAFPERQRPAGHLGLRHLVPGGRAPPAPRGRPPPAETVRSGVAGLAGPGRHPRDNRPHDRLDMDRAVQPL